MVFSLTKDDDYESRKAAIARQEKLAEMLSQMGAQEQAVSTAGGITAPMSGMGALARGLTSFGGSYLSGKAAADEAALKKAEKADAISQLSALYHLPDTTGLAQSTEPAGTTSTPYSFDVPTLPGQKPSGQTVTANLNMPNLPNVTTAIIPGAARPYEDQQRMLDKFDLSDNPYIAKMATGARGRIEAERERNQPKLVASGEWGMTDANPNSKTFGQPIIAPTVKAQKPEITGGLQRDPVTGVWSEIPGYTDQQARIAAAHRESNGGEKPPSGYRSDGKGGLEFIPGGPADPGKKTRPPSQAFLRLETDDLKDVQLAGGIASDLDSFAKKIDTGKMTLGLVPNWGSKAELAVGMANQNAQEIGSFRTSLEKLRNDSLRLNKGTQTEGDAVRAWNELFQNINDQGFVRKRIDEIQQINRRAQAQRIMLVNDRRELSGYDPIDENKYLKQPSAYENSNGAAVPGAGGAGPANLPSGTVYSPSRKQYRDPSGKLYDQNGKPL